MRQAWLPPHKASGSFNYETYMMKMMHMMRSRLWQVLLLFFKLAAVFDMVK
jgi:hypothetical protein